MVKMLKVTESAVSDLQQRADAYVPSLQCYIEAVGGKLKIAVELPDGEVARTNFYDMGEDEDNLSGGR